jgi:hypothetical protein
VFRRSDFKRQDITAAKDLRVLSEGVGEGAGEIVFFQTCRTDGEPKLFGGLRDRPPLIATTTCLRDQESKASPSSFPAGMVDPNPKSIQAKFIAL